MRANDRTGTRQRVLEVSLRLFNRSGLTRVTTAEIARAAGINEGNLYYYFQRKKDLVAALFGIFEARLMKIAAPDFPAGADLQDFMNYLHGWFSLMWEWRCFYWDGAGLFHIAPNLRARVRGVYRRGQAQVRNVFDKMAERGVMRATPEERRQLVVNAWIAATYWLEYIRMREGISVFQKKHVEQGRAQVLSLIEPYLISARRPRVASRPSRPKAVPRGT